MSERAKDRQARLHGPGTANDIFAQCRRAARSPGNRFNNRRPGSLTGIECQRCVNVGPNGVDFVRAGPGATIEKTRRTGVADQKERRTAKRVARVQDNEGFAEELRRYSRDMADPMASKVRSRPLLTRRSRI